MQKHIFLSLIGRVYAFGNYVMLGALALTMGKFAITPPKTAEPTADMPKTQVAQASGSATLEQPLLETFFNGEIPEHTINSIVEQKEEFITTRRAYSASLKVIQKHEDTILEKAEKYGVPADVAIGVGLLENGGSETAESTAGALGVFQLMPGTARNLGLTVNKKVDERKDPAKNIDAGMRYLISNYQIFGDWGLATWAYHAGEGNVAKAVQLYFKEKHHVTLAGLKDADQMKRQIQNKDANVHKVLSSSAVKKFTKKLNDDSSGYPYKVLATAKLFKKSKIAG
jgi:soluble lytic murein transglycosylase-like protein